MQEDQNPEAPRQGATFHCFGVMKLKKVKCGKASHWGGTCARYIVDEELLKHLPKDRDPYDRIALKVVINIRPERAKRLGLELTRRSSVQVEVYAINLAQATVFARLKKYLPHGNPWVLGYGYTYDWLDDSRY